MWECYVCSFQNVDAAPVCAKCRARKPAPGEEPKGRNYGALTEAARMREADKMMEYKLPAAPSFSELKEKWEDITQNPSTIHIEMARLEHRQYAIRDGMQQLVSLIKNPHQRGADDLLKGVLRMLKTWDGE